MTTPQQLYATLEPIQQLNGTLQQTGPAGPPGPAGPAGADGLPHIIQDEGVALATFDTLNFAGAGVTASVDTPGARITVTIPGGGAVDSVFGRSGVVVAANGDYTAAMVTNAVSLLGSYADPAWITSLAYAKLTGVPSSFTPSAHVHAAADTTSGVFAVARLGTGTPSASNFLRGDGAWTAIAAGHTIEDEGTARTQRTKLNFVGAGVTVTDDSGNDRTIVTIPTGTQTPWTSNINGGAFALSNTSSIEIRAVSYPLLALYDSTGSANQKWWRFILITGNDFRLECLQDGGTATTAMEIIRTGAAPTDAYIYCPLTVTKLTVTAAQGITVSLLPSTNPGAGTKQLYYLPGDSNRVYYAA